MTDHLHVIATAEVEFYSGEIGDSPIARDDVEAGLGLSVVWHF